jgi:hypothetical protein
MGSAQTSKSVTSRAMPLLQASRGINNGLT